MRYFLTFYHNVSNQVRICCLSLVFINANINKMRALCGEKVNAGMVLDLDQRKLNQIRYLALHDWIVPITCSLAKA